ncbi:MAG: VTT domain-containing protein [Patescibacteria group bacterium]
MTEFLRHLILEPGIWGAVGLFLVSGIDEIIAPIPSSLILVGELLFLKNPITIETLNQLVFFVGFPIALGTTIGSFVIYGAAYAGGRPALEGLKTRLRLKGDQFEKFEGRFQNNWYDELLFLFFRAVPLMPTMPVTLVAGIIRMKPWKYALLTFIGIFIRVMITLVILRMGGEAVFTHLFNL